jgi:hypothetical protein
MAEDTAPQASATFGVPTAKVQEAKDIDLEAIGLEPVDDEDTPPPSETPAPTPEDPSPEPEASVAEPSADDTPPEQEAEPSGPVSREELNRILGDREREWQRRKDQEVHRERARLQGELDTVRRQQEQEQLLALDPSSLHDHIHQQAQQAAQPSLDQVTHEVTRRIYSEDVLAPIRALPQFSALSDEDFQSTVRQAVVSSDRPVSDVINWLYDQAYDAGKTAVGTATDAARQAASASNIKAQDAPADAGGQAPRPPTLAQLQERYNDDEDAFSDLAALEKAAKSEGVDLRKSIFG